MTTETITEAELAAYYERRGDVLSPKDAAMAAFANVTACREPGAAEPKPAAWAQDHANRYFRAAYGPDYIYRAPETFGNLVERWIWAVGADAQQMAEACIADIERHAAKVAAHNESVGDKEAGTS